MSAVCLPSLDAFRDTLNKMMIACMEEVSEVA